MGLFKADFYRFFALGFGGGALLVLGMVGLGNGGSLSDTLVSPAKAETAPR